MRFFLHFSITAVFILFLAPAYAQETDSSIYMDFRNQKITDILYSLADICGESVLIDETVTGSATFRFEDRDFESALNRFARHCQLYVKKDDGVFTISKVSIAFAEDNTLSINTENVQIEPFINTLSRFANRTIVFDALPPVSVTIRVQGASLEDVLNLAVVKLSGFGLERIADGFYITKSSGNLNKRNIDIFTVSETEGTFSVSIQKASFQNVIDTLFKKASREYSLLAKPNAALENLNYSGKDFDELLSLILNQSCCDYSVLNGIYFIYEIQKKDVLKKFKEIKTIPLKHISSESLISLLPSELNSSGFVKGDRISNSIILTGSPAEITPIEDFIAKIDIPVSDCHFKSFCFENISAKDAVNAIPKTLLFSDIILLPSANGFVMQVTEESEKKLTEFISILDNKKQNHAVKLKYIKSDELLKALPPSVSKENIIQTSEPTLVFFSGTEKQFADFSNDMKHIDCPKQQIKYQLLVIQRQKTDGFNWSMSLKAQDSTESSGYSWSGLLSNIFSINFDIISQFGVQFAGSLNAELSNGKSRILADTTLNGISGETISFSNTNTFRYRDIIVDTKGDLYTSTTREIASGLVLSINGWVSGDGMITVKADAQVSKQGTTNSSSSDASSADTSPPPSTSEKKVSTNIRTKSGEPVIIGGLIQQEEDMTVKKFPVLGSIPILGNLFKSRNVTMSDTEFVIYLVPFVEKDKGTVLSEKENLERLKAKYGNTENQKAQ